MLKIVTMTTGELDFDSIFRQDPAGGSDDAEEVPFPPISYMLWIVFIIIMPVLLNNMLVCIKLGLISTSYILVMLVITIHTGWSCHW